MWRLLSAAFLIASVLPATACDEQVGVPLAKAVTSEIGTMIHFTKAACLITSRRSKCTLLCVSDLNIQGLNRNIVLLFVTASAGKKMQRAGISKFDSIVFADRELLLKNHALEISAQQAAAFAVGPGEKPADAANRAASYYREIEYKRPKS